MILKYLTKSMVLIYSLFFLILITSCKEEQEERNIGETEPLTETIKRIEEKQISEKVKKILNDTNKVKTIEDKEFLREQIKKLAKEKPSFAEDFAKKHENIFDKIKKHQREKVIRASFGEEVLIAYKKLKGL